MCRGRSRYHIISLLPFLFSRNLRLGTVRHSVASGPKFLLRVYYLDKWHSLEFLKTSFWTPIKHKSYSFRTVSFIQIVNIWFSSSLLHNCRRWKLDDGSIEYTNYIIIVYWILSYKGGSKFLNNLRDTRPSSSRKEPYHG